MPNARRSPLSDSATPGASVSGKFRQTGPAPRWTSGPRPRSPNKDSTVAKRFTPARPIDRRRKFRGLSCHNHDLDPAKTMISTTRLKSRRCSITLCWEDSITQFRQVPAESPRSGRQVRSRLPQRLHAPTRHFLPGAGAATARCHARYKLTLPTRGGAAR
jgi:hypothetical protein